MREGERYFAMGSVVRWRGKLCIAKESALLPADGKMRLIPIDASNVEAGPSMTWPTRFVCGCGLGCTDERDCELRESEPDPTCTVDTVEYVASNVEELVLRRLQKLMFS